MVNNKVLHLMLLEKFNVPFIEFVAEHFDMAQHQFVFLQVPQYKYGMTEKTDVIWIDKKYKVIELLRYMYEADKIIIHGLWSGHLINLLFLQPWLLKKCYWVIWGGDLYNYRIGAIPKTFSTILYDFRKRMIIKKFHGIICYNKTEYNYASKWYGAKGKFYQSFFYLSNLFKEFKIVEKKLATIFIQVGNSADPLNNHLEVFNKLEKFKNEDITIVVPLSYGNEKYREEVIKVGREKFGTKFKPLTKFVSFSDYLQILGNIDIAIFNHPRQQAMGNIISLLGFGKKIYMRPDISSWDLFKEIGVKVYDINKLDISLIDEIIKVDNIKKAKEYFSIENLISQWKMIFYESE